MSIDTPCEVLGLKDYYIDILMFLAAVIKFFCRIAISSAKNFKVWSDIVNVIIRKYQKEPQFLSLWLEWEQVGLEKSIF